MIPTSTHKQIMQLSYCERNLRHRQPTTYISHAVDTDSASVTVRRRRRR